MLGAKVSCIMETRMTNYPEGRKAPVRLTEEEAYAIYKYCVENHCLKQVEDETTFWVEPVRIAKEINLTPRIVNGKTISSYHIKNSVADVILWQKLLDKLPVQPLETVELEQLRESKLKLVHELENLKISFARATTDLTKLATENERLKKSSGAQQKLDRIRAIVSV